MLNHLYPVGRKQLYCLKAVAAAKLAADGLTSAVFVEHGSAKGNRRNWGDASAETPARGWWCRYNRKTPAAAIRATASVSRRRVVRVRIVNSSGGSPRALRTPSKSETSVL